MNFHMGTATGIGGAGGAQPTGPQTGIIGGGAGCGYCIFTSMDVVSFFGIITGGFTFAGRHPGPMHAGAAAGITIG